MARDLLSEHGFNVVTSEDGGYSYVEWQELERLGEPFRQWLTGQTVTEDGVFSWDLERYLLGLPVID